MWLHTKHRIILARVRVETIEKLKFFLVFTLSCFLIFLKKVSVSVANLATCTFLLHMVGPLNAASIVECLALRIDFSQEYKSLYKLVFIST